MGVRGLIVWRRRCGWRFGAVRVRGCGFAPAACASGLSVCAMQPLLLVCGRLSLPPPPRTSPDLHPLLPLPPLPACPQHGLILPCWVMVVFKAFMLI